MVNQAAGFREGVEVGERDENIEGRLSGKPSATPAGEVIAKRANQSINRDGRVGTCGFACEQTKDVEFGTSWMNETGNGRSLKGRVLEGAPGAPRFPPGWA
jgi:hypothetical protein